MNWTSSKDRADLSAALFSNPTAANGYSADGVKPHKRLSRNLAGTLASDENIDARLDFSQEMTVANSRNVKRDWIQAKCKSATAKPSTEGLAPESSRRTA